MATATDGSEGGMQTPMGTSSIAVLTAVHYLHLNAIAFLPIRSQLIPWVADASKRARAVVATVGTGGLAGLTLINVLTVFTIVCQSVSRTTATLNAPPVVPTCVHAAPTPYCTRASQLAVLSILCELVVVSAAALVMSWGQLDTVLLTASIADDTGADNDAGPRVRMKTGAGVALAVVGAPGVHAAVLATPVVDLTFVNIWTCVSHVVAIVSIETGVAVSGVVPVPVQKVGS